MDKRQGRSLDHEIADTELAEILASHHLWLESDGEDGNQANLIHVVGLKRGRLARANLDGSILPDYLNWDNELAYVQRVVDIGRPIYWILLILCSYTIAVVFSTEDIDVITNSRIQMIPESALGVPVSHFFTGVPVGLFGLYIYLHLYLFRLWRILGSFPAVFSDGTPVHQAVSPWLPVALVRFHQKYGVGDPSPTALSQKWLTILLVWWVPPATLTLVWARYIVMHDWTGTAMHLGLAGVAVWSAIVLYALSVSAMCRNDSPFRGWWGACSSMSILLSVCSFFLLISVISIETEQREVTANSSKGWFDKILSVISVRSSANLVGADLTDANLSGADLRRAILTESKLENADLSGANLHGANLSDAELKNANLAHANLERAILWQAGLWGSNLANSNLRDANLIGANLWNADARGADLSRANLNGARLTRINFGNATLTNSDLSDTDLKGAIMFRAGLKEADLSGSQLDNANLFGAMMHQSNLFGSVLNGVDLSKATGLRQDQLDHACGSNVHGLPNELNIKPCPK